MSTSESTLWFEVVVVNTEQKTYIISKYERSRSFRNKIKCVQEFARCFNSGNLHSWSNGDEIDAMIKWSNENFEMPNSKNPGSFLGIQFRKGVPMMSLSSR